MIDSKPYEASLESPPVKSHAKPNIQTHEASEHESQQQVYLDSLKEIKAKKAKKPSTYLQVFPEWDCSLISRKMGIPIMKNGSCCDSFKDGKKRVLVTNTCAFDSILLLVMQALNLFPSFKELIEESENEMGKLALTMISDGKMMAKHYKTRFELLKSLWIYHDQLQKNRFLTSLKCEVNAAHLSEFLFGDISSSYTMINECQNCNHKTTKQNIHVPIDLQVLLSKQINRVQAAIDEIRISSVQAICSKCKKAATIRREYGPFLLIDTSAVTSSDIFNNRKPFPLETLDTKLKFEKDTYNLVGAIHFIEFDKKLSKGGMDGHYLAYFYNGNHWYKFDDLNQSREFSKPEELIAPHLLFYVKR